MGTHLGAILNEKEKNQEKAQKCKHVTLLAMKMIHLQYENLMRKTEPNVLTSYGNMCIGGLKYFATLHMCMNMNDPKTQY